MIYILGAGAMARETLNIYRDLGRYDEVGGFIEEGSQRQNLKIHGKSVLDSSVIDSLPKESVFVGAIGSPKRRRWIEEIARKGFNFDTVLHPSAVIGEFVSIGEGSIICPGVVLTCDITIGRHSMLNIGSTVSHDCVIGDFVTVAPGVSIAGNVRVGDGSWLSVGVKIVNDVTIGAGSFIGAGAVVTEEIPDGVLALGTPAKLVKKLAESDWEELT